MKNLRNLMAAVTLAMVLMVGTSMANTGILMTDLKGDDTQPCTETKVDWGVIIHSVTGVIIHSVTGVIIHSATDTNTNCGVIIHS